MGLWPLLVPEEFEQSNSIELVAFYYLRHPRGLVNFVNLETAEWYFQFLINWAVGYILPSVGAGLYPIIHLSGHPDAPWMIPWWAKTYGHIVDLEIVATLGENLPENDPLQPSLQEGSWLRPRQYQAQSYLPAVSFCLECQGAQIRVLDSTSPTRTPSSGSTPTWSLPPLTAALAHHRCR
ncbi:hypothetical protein QBC47DRAFT_465488 [Echria macrotheca]|uniref:Uncharacterized protein n=1 Tax=Echria macrotheca TaxID=438768 RepID=A0AAJ0F5X5_9PEZI|nr:hypothetical protein QBC47DRAFT_465488 [Echria macrotheca]